MMSNLQKITDLKIIIFSQQNGDCIHITINDSVGILIDTGKVCNYDRVSEILKKEVREINYIVITHNHSDHIGAIKNFLNDNHSDIKGVISWIDSRMSFDFEKIKMIKKIYDLGKENNFVYFNVDSIETFNALNENIQILYPIEGHAYSKRENKNSIIISFKIRDKYVLFTGDATIVEENKLRKMYDDILENTVVVKLGHHGSKTSSRKTYIEKIATDNLKVVTCSCRDDWNLTPPHKEHIEMIREIVEESNNRKLYFTGNSRSNSGPENKNYDIYIHCKDNGNEVEVQVDEQYIS